MEQSREIDSYLATENHTPEARSALLDSRAFQLQNAADREAQNEVDAESLIRPEYYYFGPDKISEKPEWWEINLQKFSTRTKGKKTNNAITCAKHATPKAVRAHNARGRK